MDKYYQYNSNDFIVDADFRRWVLHPTPELDLIWHEWLQENPHKAASIIEAKQVVSSLRVKHLVITDTEIQASIQQTAQYFKSEEPLLLMPEVEVPWYKTQWTRVAASILLVLGIGWGLYHNRTQNAVPTTYQNLIAHANKSLQEKVNTTNQPLRVRLEDGSLVTLQKESRISYKVDKESSVREVFLTGEAFFEVAKDPNKPFLVYANEIVTKVLGTSFTIKAYEARKEVAVEVKTGKVSVFAGSDTRLKAKAHLRELEGVILTPNQRILYSREEVRMVKSLVEQPVVVTSFASASSFIFEETPISEVFATLENQYKIDVIYDEELLRNCPLTASLTNQPFFEKLSIICKAIEARYEVIDGQVVISGKGCN